MPGRDTSAWHGRVAGGVCCTRTKRARPAATGPAREPPRARSRMTRKALLLIVAAVSSSCGNRPNPPPPEKKDAAPVDAEVVELAARPLGMADLAAYGWRKRAGQPAFRLARKAEERGDWAAVVAVS